MADETLVQATPDTTSSDSSTPAAPPTDTETQATPDAVTPGTPSATTEFLRVNDRTVYKTQEDAVKGWTEAQQRITSLSEWEKVAKDYGVTDPKAVAELFNELLEARKGSQAAQPTTTTQTTVADAIAGDKAAYESLSPEWKAQVDYLQKIGFVTSDKLKPLEQRLSAFEASRAAEADQRVESARNDGLSILAEKLSKSGLPNDDDAKTRIGRSIASSISDTSRDSQGRLIRGSEEDRFINGTREDRAAIIDEHLKWFDKFGKSVATSQTASTVAQKTANMANTPRALPTSTSAVTSRKGRMTPEERSAAVARMLEQGA
jgi:hypothetical protein